MNSLPVFRLLRSTAVRLALGYAGLFALSSLILLGLLWWQTGSFLDREVDAAVIADTQAIGDSLRRDGLAGAIRTMEQRIASNVDENAIYLLADPALTPIAGNLTAWPSQVERETGWYHVELVRGANPHATRLLHLGLPGGFHVLVGRDVQERETIRLLILQALGWSSAAALLLALLGSLFLRRAILGRVDMINRTAVAIVQGDLAHRIPGRDTSDEFDQLTRTLNGMLDQIQKLIEGVRNVSNAVAHELRTPLTVLRARLEDLVHGRPDATARQAELEQAVADVDRLINIFNALLRLAEIDSGLRRSGFRTVDLAGLVRDIGDLYAPVSEEKGIAFSLQADTAVTVTGDSYLLSQAVGNLLDNALKYTPPQGQVRLSLSRRDNGDAMVTVADNGAGISATDLQQVTERFYRGANARGVTGLGLGLSVVTAVAQLHGGSLELSDGHPGLTATLILPVGTAPAQ